MTINELVHGFRVVRIREIPDLSGTFYELEHEKTGAHLAWMKNNEENKLFSVAFKTIPFDDSGVFHILEHSVLGGSVKYPVKEPFLEMLKSSLNTFLNAMTFPDMTVFPVSSRNDTDFMNLVGVYLDAVFCPLIYKERRIFEQEGWHVELSCENDVPKFKGVVFNEMKGALSPVNSRIMTEMCRLLYPENCYRFESGGDPVSIPNLTYEKFIETHRRFYTPSNAFFYIDGPCDIDSVLRLIDDWYLSKYNKGIGPVQIPLQKSISPVSKRLEYDLSSAQPLEANAYIAFGKVIGTYEELEKLYAVSAISEALAGSNEAPLKRALLDTEKCLDFSMFLEDGVLQPFGMLEIMNTDEEYVEELSRIIINKTSEIVSTGIDKEAMSAAIDRMEFRYLEGNEPKGLDRDLAALTAWIHGSDPVMYLDCAWVFDKLRELLSTDYYERLLSDWILDENGTARLVMIPSYDFGTKQNREEERRVSNYVSSMTAEEKSELVDENKRLNEWQQSEDSPAALSSLPLLPLSEVSEKPMKYETRIDDSLGVTVLRHPAKERGITAISLYFDVGDLSSDELFLLKTISSMIGELPTRDHTALQLSQKINSVFGDLYFTVDAFAEDNEINYCKPYFIARGSFLDGKLNEAFALIAELLNETLYLPELIKEQLVQMKENFRQGIISRGSSYAMRRVMASTSALGSFNELTSGFESYSGLSKIISDFELNGESVADTIRVLMDKTCCVGRMTIGATSFEDFSVGDLIKRFEIGSPCQNEKFSMSFHIPDLSGIIIPAQVAFTAQCFDSPVKDTSSWRVLSSILSLEYLWNEIRVKGGAYGASSTVNGLGIVGFSSFRDPDPANTLEVYSRTRRFVDSFLKSVPSLEKYIIGTVAKQEPLISDSSRGVGADELYFRGISEEKRIEKRRRLLAVTKEDVGAAAEHLSCSVHRCIVASEPVLGLFKSDGIELLSI